MPAIERFALVPHAPDQMFDLVQDVSAYPEFLSWIEKAWVDEQTEDAQRATLALNLVGVRAQFTTLNQLNPPHGVQMALVEGPFKTLSGQWKFEPFGTGSRVTLALMFEVNPGLWSSALTTGFGRVADRMVDDFCQRAFEVFGDES